MLLEGTAHPRPHSAHALHPTKPKGKQPCFTHTARSSHRGMLLPKASGTSLALHKDPRQSHGPPEHFSHMGTIMRVHLRVLGTRLYYFRAPSCQDLAEPCLSIFPWALGSGCICPPTHRGILPLTRGGQQLCIHDGVKGGQGLIIGAVQDLCDGSQQGQLVLCIQAGLALLQG